MRTKNNSENFQSIGHLNHKKSRKNPTTVCKQQILDWRNVVHYTVTKIKHLRPQYMHHVG